MIRHQTLAAAAATAAPRAVASAIFACRSAIAAATLLAASALLQGAAAQQASFDRSKPPELGPAPQLTLPPITERVLPNGLRLIVVEHRELPLVNVSLVARSGVEAEPAERNGVATLMASLLTEGAGTRSSIEIAEQMAFLGISVSASSSWDQTTVTVFTPTSVLDSALALFGDVALRPTFPQQEFDRLKRQRQTQLLQVADRGPALADRAFARIVFGDDHPYGRPLAGIESTVEAITRDDVEAFYKSAFVPNNAFLLVVGDVRVADIERRARALFGAWEQGTPPTVRFPAVPPQAERRIYVVDKAAAPQASFRIGAVGVPRSTPDYYTLQVLNTILGGSFTSRLNQHLREDKGYTYGASSGFSMRREAGPFVARSEIVSARSDSALLIFLADLGSMHTPVPADELDRARRYLQLGLPGGYETVGDIAFQLSTYALHGLPLDEPTRAVQRLGAVTEADITRAAQQYLDPSKMAVVISGDARTLVPMLRATRTGPVELRDGYGRPIGRPAIVQ